VLAVLLVEQVVDAQRERVQARADEQAHARREVARGVGRRVGVSIVAESLLGARRRRSRRGGTSAARSYRAPSRPLAAAGAAGSASPCVGKPEPLVGG
jgi:hypothetical protein